MTKRAEQRQETTARILTAARRVFADRGYDRATIRTIAAAAGVNPGLVMHYFGTKQQLFQRAASLTGTSGADTPERIVEALLGSLSVKLDGLPIASTAALRSMLTHPEAAHDVRIAVNQQTTEVAAAIDADDPALRATLIETTILGVVIGRHLLGLDALHDATTQQITDLLRPCFELLARS